MLGRARLRFGDALCRFLLAVALVTVCAGCSGSGLPSEVETARSWTAEALAEHSEVFAAMAEGTQVPSHGDAVAKRRYTVDIAEIGRQVESLALDVCDKALFILSGELQSWSQAYDGWFEPGESENQAQLQRISVAIVRAIETIRSEPHTEVPIGPKVDPDDPSRCRDHP